MPCYRLRVLCRLYLYLNIASELPLFGEESFRLPKGITTGQTLFTRIGKDVGGGGGWGL